jgi:cell fate regulator YaaT (PSP1 superfamily)
MGCTTCTTKTSGIPKGCKNNGTCGADGCNKLTVFDWLADISLPSSETPFNVVEVRFKNGRKHFYKNEGTIPLYIGDIVATQAMSGHDIGIVTLTGELVRIQMKKKKENTPLDELPKIYRKATQKDIDIWQKMRDKEPEVQKHAREIAMRLGLKMKISDVEYQGDGSKVTFYYTAEERVDFRQLIKDFAQAFSTRIEMKQVGFRQEAARLGGIGSCGRELCCSTWLTDFRSVNTAAARYQQLALNPQKLAGQCGKLKCCLNYELDTYLEALEIFPKNDQKLLTKKGVAACQKIDIFNGFLWYAYLDDPANWHKLSVTAANDIIKQNEKGEKPAGLEEFEEKEVVSTEAIFSNVVGQDSLTRFDKPKKRRKNSRRKNTNANKSKNRNPKKNA